MGIVSSQVGSSPFSIPHELSQNLVPTSWKNMMNGSVYETYTSEHSKFT